MTYLQVNLVQTSYNKPNGDCHGIFHNERRCFQSFPEALKALSDDFGITVPKRPRGVYIGDGVQVGFMHGSWQNEGDGNYWVESWVTFCHITETTPLLPKEMRAHL